MTNYFASHKKVGQPFVTSRWYFQPPAQSSALGSMTLGHMSPALLRTSLLTFVRAPSNTTSKINANVKKRIKFHELKSCTLTDDDLTDFFFVAIYIPQ